MQLALTGELNTSFKLGGEDSIIGFVTSSGNAVNEKKLDLSSVLKDSAFVTQISPNSLFENKLSVWGVGNQQDISAILAKSNQNVNGELFSRHVGTDLKFDFGGLAGLGISTSEIKTSLQGFELNRIEFKADTTMMNSYFGWMSPDQAITLKVIGGYGEGTVAAKHADFGPILYDSNIYSMSLSGDVQLASFGSSTDIGEFDLRIKGDVIDSRSSFAHQENIVNNFAYHSNQTKLFSELSHSLITNRGSTLVSQLLFGGYRYRKNGSINVSSEIGNAFRYFDPKGFTLAMKSQLPLFEYGNILENAGIGGDFQYDSGDDELGVQLLGSAKFGLIQDDLKVDLADQNLWSHFSEYNKLDSVWKVSGEIGYGLEVGDGLVNIKPFSGMNHSGDTFNQYYLGTEVEFGSGLKFELKGSQEFERARIVNRKIQFDGTIYW